MPVLTGIDVLGIQRFIFSSNRMKDVVAGSWLVHWATSEDGLLGKIADNRNILLAAGGNAIIEFPTQKEAHHFIAHYTRRLYEHAPGLVVAVAHRPFSSGKLANTLLELQRDLAQMKLSRKPSVPLMGISVTASCRETGLPAVGFDSREPAIPLSDGILKRRNVLNDANRRWSSFLGETGEYDFPLELDDLGRSRGETSLIGVLHMDGNGVGRKIMKWLQGKQENGTDEKKVREEFRTWSSALKSLGERAFREMLALIILSIVEKDGKRYLAGFPKRLNFSLHKSDDDKWLLPLRPLLLGGDDLTFVCDGRIALSLADRVLQLFADSHIPYLGKIGACVGVALVRVHEPVVRAYMVAEELCRTAKAKLRKDNRPDECALDWHIGLPRPGEDMTTLRRRNYQFDRYRLTCRPYCLGQNGEGETWRWLMDYLLDNPDTGLRGLRWSQRRNKVKEFPGLIMDGPDGVNQALESWKIVDPSLALPRPIHENGFVAGSRTPLLDALEIMDLHLVLKEGDESEGYQEAGA